MAFAETGCQRPSSDGPLIQRYKAASCVPFSAHPKISPHTREWDTPLTLGDGSKVIVGGGEIAGGRISVKFLATGRNVIAANAGDYIYPSDVRMDVLHDHLYVKATGAAGGMRHQTWLFEYDLRAQLAVAHQQVMDSALPSECPE